MNPAALESLRSAVQRHADIADARHAGDLSLCSYLLQMREFCRWALGHAPGAPVDRAAVGRWIAAREAHWDTLEHADFGPLPLDDGQTADPFDAAAVNRRLLPQGLLYGAGLVARDRPVFFLARLHSRSDDDGLEVMQAGTELARGLLAPPAALAGPQGPVLVRREVFERLVFVRLEAWQMRPAPGSALDAAVRHHGLDRDAAAGMPAWRDTHVDLALLHEQAEWQLSRRWGADWTALRRALPGARDEARARALRDLCADLSTTLPRLLDTGQDGALHTWFAGFEGLRLALFPGLPRAYLARRTDGHDRALRSAVARGAAHFESLAHDLLTRWRESGPPALAGITACLAGPGAVCSD